MKRSKRTRKGPSKAESDKRRWNEWKKFLKDDCDFDFVCILRMLAYKLERTRKHILSHNILLRAKEIHDEIKEAEDLLKKVVADDYLEELWEPFKKKYGSLQMAMVPKTIDGKKLNVAKFRFSKDNKSNRGAAFKAWRKRGLKAREAMVADLDRAFGIMSEKIWGWWD